MAETVCRQIQELGVHGYIEFSGYKGYHVWVFWLHDIALQQQKAFFRDVLCDIEIPTGLHIEKIPIIDDEQKIKLPLSHHAIHGKQAHFITDLTQEEFISQIKRSHYPEQKKVSRPNQENTTHGEYCPPAHIQSIYNKCHIVKKIIDKAKQHNFISYPERTTLLHIFHCLGDEGAQYIHYVMSFCMNYDYAITQKHIDGCSCINPLGCKKLSLRFEDVYGKAECTCNFKDVDMYPSPVIHAKKILPGCFNSFHKEENIGHFQRKPVKQNTEDILSRLIELNKQQYEINVQQKICAGQIKNLLARNEILELQTPQGLLINNESGLFIKVG